jgi:Ca2+-binding EF-hand superfamily protein
MSVPQVSLAELTELINFMFDQVDKDKSNFLEKNECHEVAVALQQSLNEKSAEAKPFNEEAFEKAFTTLDKSGDGKISREELLGFFVQVARTRGVLQE